MCDQSYIINFVEIKKVTEKGGLQINLMIVQIVTIQKLNVDTAMKCCLEKTFSDISK